jgi:hypothetical protein
MFHIVPEFLQPIAQDAPDAGIVVGDQDTACASPPQVQGEKKLPRRHQRDVAAMQARQVLGDGRPRPLPGGTK